MPASVRFEVFPSDLNRCIEFYTKVLRFDLRQRDADGSYAYMIRDAIRIGAAVKPGSNYPNGKGAQTEYRMWPTGVEIVFEVDDLEAERDWIVGRSGWPLDDDIKLQAWGLRDFRVKDPDGYYIRITTPGREEQSDKK